MTRSHRGFAFLFLFAGCNFESSPNTNPEQLQGRLESALAITNTAKKDEALKTVATDAASAGAGEIVTRAIGGIHNTATKDQAAAKCALRLSDKGHNVEAMQVAKMISNTATRDETLERIAKSSN